MAIEAISPDDFILEISVRCLPIAIAQVPENNENYFSSDLWGVRQAWGSGPDSITHSTVPWLDGTVFGVSPSVWNKY